jgi:hypothetical protein
MKEETKEGPIYLGERTDETCAENEFLTFEMAGLTLIRDSTRD